jgi:chloramphenicol O-acetyltransferase type A
MENWQRMRQFQFYNAFEHPHLGITANVDLTKFYPYRKIHQISFTIAIVYVLTRAANAIAEFRYRIRDGKVIEHDVVHPSFTILVSEDVFSFCFTDYLEDFNKFTIRTAEVIEAVRANLVMEDDPDRDDYLFMTAIPWIPFTHLEHPLPAHPGDAIPLMAWGKSFPEGDRLKMPLNIKVHHALVDGVHAGRFYKQVQYLLDNPEESLGIN